MITNVTVQVNLGFYFADPVDNFLLPKGQINPLNVELNPICHFLALLGAHHILHVSRIRVNPEEF
jgi:hypothetical protein